MKILRPLLFALMMCAMHGQYAYAQRLMRLFTLADSTMTLAYLTDVPTTWKGHAVTHSELVSSGTAVHHSVGYLAKRAVIDPSVAAYTPTSLNRLFALSYTLEHIEGLQHLNTSQVVDFSEMFYRCDNLVALDLSTFDTRQAQQMVGMFWNCASLETLDVSSFNTSQVTDFTALFNGCKSLKTLELTHFDTRSATSMAGMFLGCSSLEQLNLERFNTAQVTTLSGMFSGCTGLNQIDLSAFQTERVHDFSYLFFNCGRLTSIDLSHFNTSQARIFDSMFSGCTSLSTLSLNAFDGSSLISADGMLNNTPSLAYVDMRLSSNFSDSKIKLIVESRTNLYTLLYLPENVTLQGENIVNTSSDHFVSAAYRVNNAVERLDIPYAFTAQRVINNRIISLQPHQADTWYMPYTLPLPAGLKAYEFASANTNEGIVTFVASNDTELLAQKPYVVVASVDRVFTSTQGDTPSEVPVCTPGMETIAGTSDGISFLGISHKYTSALAAYSGFYALVDTAWQSHVTLKTEAPAMRAYLRATTPAARMIPTYHFAGVDEVTHIRAIELRDSVGATDSRIYDLNGRYLGTRREMLRSGTYIINGKKVSLP